MRTTMKIAANTTVDNILDNYARVLRTQNQMARGQRVLDPSDDPLAANEGIRVQTLIEQLGQFDRNIEIGNSFLTTSDTALQDVNDVLKTGRSLVISMANEATTPSQRQAQVKEIEGISSEIVSIGNRRVGNRYIFGGTRSLTEPFQTVGKYVYFTGNEDDIDIQIDHNVFQNINVKASDVFGSLISRKRSAAVQPNLNIDPNVSTPLSALNDGAGVASGSIVVRYNNGVGVTTRTEIDLREADTLEDVVDIVGRETGGEVTVDLNNSRTAIVLTNNIGGQIEGIDEVASNTTARDLGFQNGGLSGFPNSPVAGYNISPNMTETTLLADLPEYFGSSFVVATGSEDLVTPEVRELQDTNNLLATYNFSGLQEGVNTDVGGELYFDVNQAGATWTIDVYKDSAMTPDERVATGTVTGPLGLTTVALTAVNASGVNGSVDLNPVVGGQVTAQAVFPDDFRATITVESFVETGDTGGGSFDQVTGWQLHGLRKGIDTDANGKLYVDVTSTAGGPPYNVNVYLDENTQNASTLVASGSLAGPSPNGMVTLTGVGSHTNVTGQVYLEYAGDDTDIELEATFATVRDLVNAIKESNTYTTAALTKDGQAIEISSRLAGATMHVMSEAPLMTEINEDDQLTRWRITGIEAGSNAGDNGELWAEYSLATDSPAAGQQQYVINLYSDATTHDSTTLVSTATGAAVGFPGPAPATPQVLTFNEVNGSGIKGSVQVDSYAADDLDIELRPNDMGLSGRRREFNIFSTMNDIIEAGTQNDTDELHNLIGNFDTDEGRVLDGRSEIGSTMTRFDLLRARIADEEVVFSNIFSQRIDLDYADAIVNFQANTNIYNAALSVAGRIVPMSLVDFI